MTQNRVQIEVTGDSKSAEDALSRAAQKTEEFAKTARKVGIALAAIGAAAGLTLTSAIKGALAERQGINLLDAALRNVGTSYKANAEAIEGVIESKRKTNFSDDEQREALQRLVVLSGDYRRSLEALPLTLDVAAGLTGDLSTASTLVGRALAGNTDIFARYGIKLREGATVTEALNALTQRLGGSAEAASDPLTRLNKAIDDLKDSIGAVMLPLLEPLAEKLEQIAKFLADHPTFAKAAAGLLAVAAAIGAIGVAFLVIAPLVSTAGLVVLAIAGIAAAGVLLWANWETVKNKALEYWPVIQIILLTVFGPVILGIEGVIAAGVWLWKNWETIKAKASEIWNAIAGFFGDVLGRIKDTWNGTWNAITETFDRVVGALIGIKNRLVDAFWGIWGFIQTQWNALWNGVHDKFDTVVGLVIGIKDRLVGAFQNIWGFITTQWDNIWNGVHDTFDRVVGTILGIRDQLVEGLKAIARMVGDPLAAVWEAIKGGVDNVIGLINGAIGTLNKAIDAYNKIPKLPNIPNIPKINEGFPSPGDSGFIGPLQSSSNRSGASASVVNNVAFNFENVSISESRRQIGAMLREIVSDGGLTDVGLQRS